MYDDLANAFFKGKITTLHFVAEIKKQLFQCFKRLGNLQLVQRYINLNKIESTIHLELVENLS